MNFIDLIPVDFLPWAWANGYVAAGHDPAHAYLRAVPTADLNTTFGLSIAVFLLIQVFGIGHKGVGGFTKEIFTAPFHAERDRTSGVEGTRVPVRVDLGGRRPNNKK